MLLLCCLKSTFYGVFLFALGVLFLFSEIWIYTKSRRLYYALFYFLNNIVLGAPRK